VVSIKIHVYLVPLQFIVSYLSVFLCSEIEQLEDENAQLEQELATLEGPVSFIPKYMTTFNVFTYFWHKMAAKHTHSGLELEELSVSPQIWHKTCWNDYIWQPNSMHVQSIH
jgi:hypothetical protein